MNLGSPQLQRVQSDRGQRSLGFAIVVGALGFILGFGMGSRVAPGPSPTGSAPSDFRAAYVSHELWTAYLNRGGQGWGICLIAAVPRCQSIAATPVDLPYPVSTVDWTRLSPTVVPGGHYVLASPLGLHEPQVTLAAVSVEGTPTIIGPSDQQVWNTVWWADLGTLGSGRTW